MALPSRPSRAAVGLPDPIEPLSAHLRSEVRAEHVSPGDLDLARRCTLQASYDAFHPPQVRDVRSARGLPTRR
jgi:hypothetical protein